MATPIDPPSRQVLARNVRRARLSLSWTQEQLASEAQTSQTYVSQVESAARGISVDVLDSLAGALGLKPHELLKPSD